jgi:hypothetical protein
MQTDHHMARMQPSYQRVIGVDPGPVPGFVVLDYTDGLLIGSSVVQCSADVAPAVLTGLLTPGARNLLGLERSSYEAAAAGREASRPESRRAT